MIEFEMLWAWYTVRIAEVRRQDRDRGDVPQWLVITGIVIVIAIAVGAILRTKFTDKANSINLQ